MQSKDDDSQSTKADKHNEFPDTYFRDAGPLKYKDN